MNVERLPAGHGPAVTVNVRLNPAPACILTDRPRLLGLPLHRLRLVWLYHCTGCGWSARFALSHVTRDEGPLGPGPS